MIYSINEGIIFSTKNSRKNVTETYKRLQTIIESYIRLNTKRLDIIDKLFSILKSADKYCIDPPKEFDDLHNDWVDAEKEYERAVNWDAVISRKAWIKWLRMGFFNRADLRNDELGAELKGFVDKAVENGEYHKKINQLKDRRSKIATEFDSFLDKAIKESNGHPVNEAYVYMFKTVRDVLYSTAISIGNTELDIKSIDDIKIKKALGYFESINFI